MCLENYYTFTGGDGQCYQRTLNSSEQEVTATGNNTFLASQCSTGYYLNVGVCTQYNFSGNAWCEFFNPDANECLRCQEEYDLVLGDKTCAARVTQGIDYC